MLLQMGMTSLVEHIPHHLRRFIAEQEYEQYTSIDHASWRYIMRISYDFFAQYAHGKYIDGLKETGITIDRIPRMDEMDAKLKRFGWRVAVITGFIPPAAFLEMLSLRILPIACDMRKLENIDYTPAPDIVHEAAGHAPIIADPAYSSYLRKFGEIARYVIFAKEDFDVYEAVLNLSEIKEDPSSTEADIDRAQKALDEAAAKVTYVSEAQQLTRLGWWTTEYGLFKKGDRFLIYGAGLLSSVGESYNCLSDKVPKIPLTIDCIEVDYDITKPQPQLFYTDDFKKLENVIDELASRMAYKRGGIYGLEKGKEARVMTTTVLESGLQISGVLTDFRTTNGQDIYFLKYSGPTQLSYNEKQIEGQGPQYHEHGFSSPIGRIKGFDKPTTALTTATLEKFGFKGTDKGRLEFASGIVLEGVCKSVFQVEGKTLIVTFTDCSIKHGDEVLFAPEWGTFDMACGEQVVSVFGGAADRAAISEITKNQGKPRPQKRNVTPEIKDLIPLYTQVREIRESGRKDISALEKIATQLSRFPNDWLLRLEILELLENEPSASKLRGSLNQDLDRISKTADNVGLLIQRGRALLKQKAH